MSRNKHWPYVRSYFENAIITKSSSKSFCRCNKTTSKVCCETLFCEPCCMGTLLRYRASSLHRRDGCYRGYNRSSVEQGSHTYIYRDCCPPQQTRFRARRYLRIQNTIPKKWNHLDEPLESKVEELDRSVESSIDAGSRRTGSQRMIEGY